VNSERKEEEKKMKAILIIADGLGGRPTDQGGETCLEAAQTPHLDELATRGALGLVDPIAPGVRPGSDTAHLSLLGYDPRVVYTGRGVFECLGIGMTVNPGDICFRANFATVTPREGRFIVKDRRADRISSGQVDLAKALNLLYRARVAYPVYHSSCSGIPLGATVNPKKFKVIFLDVGLMSTVTGLNLLDYEKADVMRVNAGAVCEQYIGQHLLFSQHPYYEPEVYYWIREKKNSSAEVDYELWCQSLNCE